MKINIPTNFNCYEELVPVSVNDVNDGSTSDKENTLYDDKGKKIDPKKLTKLANDIYKSPLSITRETLDTYKHLIVAPIARHAWQSQKDNNDLIFSAFSKDIDADEKKLFIKTGIFTGVIFYQGVAFHIIPHCGEFFLKKMLNISNNIYIENNLQNSKKQSSANPFIFIIAFLFVNLLDKARILGYPQQYRVQNERTAKFHGQLDISQLIKKDLPFSGKLSVVFRARQMVQEIIDILYSALRCVEKSKILPEKVMRLKSELLPFYSGKFCSTDMIKKAKKSHALNNPLFRIFKTALYYAEILLKNIEQIYDEQNKDAGLAGYLVDASELWEVYLEKLMANNLPDWEVMGQEVLPFYHDGFFKRDFYPDLVLKHKDSDKYAVFDAKFKRMAGRNEDVDRNDLHQIHTYAGYYAQLEELKACGLLYPCEKDPEQDKWNLSFYNNHTSNTKFVIDGVNVRKIQEADKDHQWDVLLGEEAMFIDRIKAILESD